MPACVVRQKRYKVKIKSERNEATGRRRRNENEKGGNPPKPFTRARGPCMNATTEKKDKNHLDSVRIIVIIIVVAPLAHKHASQPPLKLIRKSNIASPDPHLRAPAEFGATKVDRKREMRRLPPSAHFNNQLIDDRKCITMVIVARRTAKKARQK